MVEVIDIHLPNGEKNKIILHYHACDSSGYVIDQSPVWVLGGQQQKSSKCHFHIQTPELEGQP